jgi:hypothetical protein
MPKATALALGLACTVLGGALIFVGQFVAGVAAIVVAGVFDLLFVKALRAERRPQTR